MSAESKNIASGIVRSAAALAAFAAITTHTDAVHAQQNLDDGPAPIVDTRPAPTQKYSTNLSAYINVLGQPDQTKLTEALTKGDPLTAAILRAQLNSAAANLATAQDTSGRGQQYVTLASTPVNRAAQDTQLASAPNPEDVKLSLVSAGSAPAQSVLYQDVSASGAPDAIQQAPVNPEMLAAAEAFEKLGGKAGLKPFLDEIVKLGDKAFSMTDSEIAKAALDATLAKFQGTPAEKKALEANLEKVQAGLTLYVPRFTSLQGEYMKNSAKFNSIEVLATGQKINVEMRGLSDDRAIVSEELIVRDDGAATGGDKHHTSGAVLVAHFGKPIALVTTRGEGNRAPPQHPGDVALRAGNAGLEKIADDIAAKFSDGGAAYQGMKRIAEGMSRGGVQSLDLPPVNAPRNGPRRDTRDQTARLIGGTMSDAEGETPAPRAPGLQVVRDVVFDPSVVESTGGSGGAGGGSASGAGGAGGSGGGSSGGCFIATTNVVLAGGSEKQISEIQIGDKLIGLDGSINEVLGLVTPKLGNRQLWSFNDSPAFVTAGHPFYSKDGKWKSVDPAATLQEKAGMVVDKLEIGDTIVTKSGEVVIAKIHSSASDAEQTLHDFNLSGNHTYYADGYAVHNK